MKKYFVLFLVLCFNLFGYEYQILNNPNATGTAYKTAYYYDSNDNVLKIKYYDVNNEIQIDTASINYFYLTLGTIRAGNTSSYISNNNFVEIYKNDNLFLNDLYVQKTNAFLNYLYNENSFTFNNYIEYENYQLLYNSDGLAVESIIDGVWAGLYSDAEKGVSGRMYNDSGTLVYYNGEAVSWIGSSLDRIFGDIGAYMHQAFQILASPIGVIVSVVFVMSILYFVVRIGRNAIKPFNGKVRKRFLEDH